MNALMLIVVMIGIGAVIGGVTNSLAIKMLFRPYRPLYLGAWRLPFTPGLIPKRRGEMAEQMGSMVVNHLLTAERIQQKISEQEFYEKMQHWVSQEISFFLNSSSSLTELAGKVTGGKIERDEQAAQYMKQRLDQFLEENKDKPLHDIVPPGLLHKGDDLVPFLAFTITEKGADYFKGEEGQHQLHLLLEKFLEGKGSMLNFLGTMFGNDKIIEKLQPEIIRFFEDPASESFIRNVIAKEWTVLKEKPLSSFSGVFQTEEIAAEAVHFLKNESVLFENLDSPLSEWAPAWEETIIERLLPGVIKAAQVFIADRLPLLFGQLNLDDLVREQVDTFSVERLEEMVLTISRREFKMITYLGALLGGVVGLFQGIIVVLFSI